MRRLFTISLVLLGLGCDGGGVQPPATGAGQSIWTPSVSVLLAQDQGGGFAPQPPPGSTCTVGAKKFTLTVASRGLSWTRCVGNGTSAYQPMSSSRGLTETELKDLGPVLENLRVVKPTGSCIADASMLTVSITTPLGAQDYVDDGFQCAVKDKPLLDRQALNQVLDRLNTLATPVL